ncbi:regulatory protein RecX [Chromohalobacter canadensis]|uniref:Regulatory protein RecX n=1 Tax=Chromohalobacter canadensis TaxID=141389 RepID=A0A285VSV7_9GAMM|nr:regulatory protein RecX [Chromohalobacter canadensis]MCK0768904.1 recombination regulator RecX [Chromohalobacter canadensis]WQH07944.1 regulatory protein RecX [Chromohalobacter canadensis]SOC56668.1 regulatory protein [Chromohalobacter canadensis]
MDKQETTPRDDAIRLLARRDYSRAELVSRLTTRGHERADIALTLDGLAEEGLQSDARFAEQFVRSRLSRGQGEMKIRAELSSRGITDEMAQEALESEGPDWYRLACEALAKRFDSPGREPRERAKRERFLASRGFAFDQVRHAMAHAWESPR